MFPDFIQQVEKQLEDILEKLVQQTSISLCIWIVNVSTFIKTIMRYLPMYASFLSATFLLQINRSTDEACSETITNVSLQFLIIISSYLQNQ